MASAAAYGVGEEVGWRGFALPHLQVDHSALRATTILTVVWGVWHAPFFLYRFEFGAVQIVGFFVGLFAGAIWLTSLYNNTRGSAFAVATWHTTWNLVNQLSLELANELAAIMTVTVIVVAIAVTAVWGPTSLADGPKATAKCDRRPDK